MTRQTKPANDIVLVTGLASAAPWDNSLFLNFNDLIFDLLGWRGVLTGSDSVMKVSWCVCSGQIYVTRGTIGLILFQMLSHFLTRNNTAYNGHSQPGDLGGNTVVETAPSHTLRTENLKWNHPPIPTTNFSKSDR